MLKTLLDPPHHAEHPLAPGFEVLRERSVKLAPVIAELRAAERERQLTQSITALAPSYVHMYVNRLVRSAQRAHELVIYDLLARLYEAESARARSDFESK